MNFIKNYYKAIRKFFRDWWLEGKRDKENRLKNKTQKPNGYWARIAGVIAFWLLMAFILLITLSSVMNESDNTVATEKEETNQATLQPSIQFGENFLEEYLTLSTAEDSESRKQRLDPYVVEGLNLSENISLNEESEDQQRNMKVVDINLNSIKETGDNTALITYEVITDTEIKEAASDKKDEKKDDEKPAPPQGGENKKSFLIGVPIVNEENKHAVYSDAKISGEFDDKKISFNDNEKYMTFNGDEDAVKNFINTFFETYVEESSDKLLYMTTQDIEIASLEGKFSFVDVEEVKLGVRDNQSENPDIHAQVRVNMTDGLGINYSNLYQLVITRSDERYQVVSFEEEI